MEFNFVAPKPELGISLIRLGRCKNLKPITYHEDNDSKCNGHTAQRAGNPLNLPIITGLLSCVGSRVVRGRGRDGK